MDTVENKETLMPLLRTFSVLIAFFFGLVSYGATFEAIEKGNDAWAERFKAQNGFQIKLMVNPQYFSKKYSPGVSEKTLSGFDAWTRATQAALDAMAKDPRKREELKKKVSMVVFLAYSNEGLSDEVSRGGNGLTVCQSVQSFAKGPSADLARLIEQAILEPTKREKLNAEIERIAPLRGKVTLKLTPGEKEQLYCFANNAALVQGGVFMMSFADLGAVLSKALGKSLASAFSKGDPKSAAEIDQKLNQIHANHKPVLDQLVGFKKKIYAEKEKMRSEFWNLMTDDLIREAQKLIADQPPGLPRMEKELSDAELIKVTSLQTGALKAPEGQKPDPKTLQYFESLIRWIELATPKHKK